MSRVVMEKSKGEDNVENVRRLLFTCRNVDVVGCHCST